MLYVNIPKTNEDKYLALLAFVQLCMEQLTSKEKEGGLLAKEFFKILVKQSSNLPEHIDAMQVFQWLTEAYRSQKHDVSISFYYHSPERIELKQGEINLDCFGRIIFPNEKSFKNIIEKKFPHEQIKELISEE